MKNRKVSPPCPAILRGGIPCCGVLSDEREIRFLIPDNVGVYGRFKMRVCSHCNVFTVADATIEDEVEELIN